MRLGRLFQRKPKRPPEAEALYWAAVEQARKEIFYRDLGVPDSLDGRFEMICLHVFLLLERLKREGEDTAVLSQGVFDTMFVDMDRSLREMGAGDLGVGPRIKKMAQALYGRIAAYETGLRSEDPQVLEEFLRRNLYGTCKEVAPDHLRGMAHYLRCQQDALARMSMTELGAGRLAFAPVAEDLSHGISPGLALSGTDQSAGDQGR